MEPRIRVVTNDRCRVLDVVVIGEGGADGLRLPVTALKTEASVDEGGFLQATLTFAPGLVEVVQR